MIRRTTPAPPSGWELKLARLEDSFGLRGNGVVSGTSLSRVVLDEGGPGWCLSLGRMGMPKCHFYSRSINGCLAKARNAVAKGRTTPQTVLIG